MGGRSCFVCYDLWIIAFYRYKIGNSQIIIIWNLRWKVLRSLPWNWTERLHWSYSKNLITWPKKKIECWIDLQPSLGKKRKLSSSLNLYRNRKKAYILTFCILRQWNFEILTRCSKRWWARQKWFWR